jgi:flavin-dependent dehydrogenase
MSDLDPVLVLGGGPAGSMAALALARGGAPCRLLERNLEAVDKVCGEFLSPEAVARLDALAFPWADAQASVIRVLRLENRGRTLSIRLPFEGRSVARSFLDGWLLQSARRAGADVELGVHVRDVVRTGDHFELSAAGRALSAHTLILATGKHGLGEFHARRPAPGPKLIGWKMSFHKLGPALLRALHETLGLFLFAGGYGGISRVACDVATVSLLVQPAILQQHRETPLALLHALAGDAPLLAQVLAEAEAVWDRPKTIANLPYGHCDAGAEPSLFAVGDQFAVLPSFVGTGMSFAMATGALAARHIRLSPSATAPFLYAQEARAMAQEVLRHAMLLHRLLQRPGFARAAMIALGLVPQLVPMIARRTRVPEASLCKEAA